MSGVNIESVQVGQQYLLNVFIPGYQFSGPAVVSNVDAESVVLQSIDDESRFFCTNKADFGNTWDLEAVS